MKALCWMGVNDLSVEDVPEPTILNDQDVIVKVRASAVCGSDLHLIDGYIPAMRRGDILGHEFLGEVVEVGPGVRDRRVGERVVVCSIISCGRCRYCRRGLFSACDNGNAEPAAFESLYGYAGAGIFAYSHLVGGYAGSHAEYVRVPFADVGAFPVPEDLSDDEAVFASDGVPTGWMAADFCDIEPGHVVAVWGAGGVGQMAAAAAKLLGAARVIVIDRFPDRLRMVERELGLETLDYTRVDVREALRDLTAGRGPDACIEAVGMEAHGNGPQYAYDRVKQAARLEDRAVALREAILSCAKGGVVSVVGVFGSFVDKFPMGAVVNKGLTIRSAQQHGHRYIPMLLERMAAGEIPTAHLATHPLPLSDGVRAYDMFKHKKDGCVRAILHP
ncbi:glutathione-dependent formaldehyde dehydrogenase [Thermobifida halotolerans]|uniref:Glutathione-dependent formaldehyde dehydrogenase n=1 Tax=Thermobifida halotolerans TaxID=483545 RepID=A0A399G706_9ACTN|nr:zinc-dependent alcohol dehydrogenase [Thermobifida halotolerans]UOE20444.1 glutathione-dependent formaldehyde dehydrogenase [Thermobifida halotolerans]